MSFTPSPVSLLLHLGCSQRVSYYHSHMKRPRTAHLEDIILDLVKYVRLIVRGRDEPERCTERLELGDRKVLVPKKPLVKIDNALVRIESESYPSGSDSGVKRRRFFPCASSVRSFMPPSCSIFLDASEAISSSLLQPSVSIPQSPA